MTELECIRKACEDYKKAVHRNGPDGKPGLNDKYTVDDFYNTIVEGLDEFRKEVLEHPFFTSLNAKNLVDIYMKSYSLFMYCLQVFINSKLNTVLNTFNGNGIAAIKADPIDATIHTNEETENKKVFVKEVMDGIPRKKALKDFLDDIDSYKQFRDDVDHAMMYLDWEKIHRVMKILKWRWYHWEDEDEELHTNTVPSIYGLKSFVLDLIKRMENDLKVHPEQTQYICGCGGFEVEMWMCNVDNDPDDYEHQVRFVIRFVLEHYDNGQ